MTTLVGSNANAFRGATPNRGTRSPCLTPCETDKPAGAAPCEMFFSGAQLNFRVGSNLPSLHVTLRGWKIAVCKISHNTWSPRSMHT